MLTLLSTARYICAVAGFGNANNNNNNNSKANTTTATQLPSNNDKNKKAAAQSGGAGVAAITSMSTKMNIAKPIYVFSGPSGCGKSTLIKRIMSEFPDRFAFKISHTTRQPRQGEKQGVDYHYVDKATMDKMIANNEFIEYATFAGNTYGTSTASIQEVLKTGRVCLMDIDMQGVKSVKKTGLPVIYIFIKPPSLEELERRLRGRGTETEDSVQKRLAAAKSELEYANDPSAYNHVIVNDSLEAAYAQLKKILVG